ncbi:membrane protein insertion efficiency factor YidD [bacterium]|nr:membrane protein insertion efficiency factor YidD [bacterium]MCI0605702.1 membrane protein insertion efficiency factor YidD [bacterium]
MNQSAGSIVVLSLLRFYQRFLSPLLIPACRFTPTCSQYAHDAVSKYGAFKGIYLGIKRILRCNPFCKGGFDPVR